VSHKTPVATYPTADVRAKSKGASSKKKTHGSHQQRLFKEKVRKTKRGMQNLKIRVQELFMQGKVLAPHASVTKDNNL